MGNGICRKESLKSMNLFHFVQLREVEEECGISQLTIVKELAVTYHTYRQAEENVLKITYWFLMNV